jgi:DNA-binding MarR family transcriptional regulator
MDDQMVTSIKLQCQIVNKSCANANLRRATRALTRLYDQILAPSGLLTTQFTLLVACAVAGPAPISTLADALAMDRTTLARNLKLLERHNLVILIPGEDRRERIVMLSEKSYPALSKALPLWQEAQTQVIESFGQDRLDDLLKDLSAMVDLTRES